MSHLQTNNPPAENSGDGRLYGGQTQQERRDQRRRQLLEAALDVFGTEGFSHATVRGICRQAQLTDRYFYAEFGNLEALLRAVYSDCMDRIYLRLTESLNAGENMQQLVQSALTMFFTELEDPRVARICMLELEGVSEETDTHYLGYIRRFAQLLMAVARRVHPHWQISDEDAELLGLGLVGAMRQMSVGWLLSGYAASRDTLVRSGSRLIMGLVLQLQQEN